MRLFESGKTTRQIEAILNDNLPDGERPFTQPTIARYLKPFRAQVSKDQRDLVNSTFMEDLEKLNTCIQQNFAVANGHRLDQQTGAPKRRPDGTYETSYYDQAIKLKARSAVISAVLKKFEYLGDDEKVIYHEVSGRDGGPIDCRKIPDDELDSRIENLQQKHGEGADAVQV